MSAPAPARLMNAGEVARHLGVHRRTVQRWWTLGLLPYVKIAGRRRTPLEALRAFDADAAERAIENAREWRQKAT